MALVTPYVTLAEADVYLDGITAWESSEDEQKNAALFWGRVFIDSKYNCPDHDPDDPTDEIKYANALLAEDYINGTLLQSDGTGEPSISEKSVKAGPVEVETKYIGGEKDNNQQDVDALLSGQCRKKGSNLVIVTRN